MSNLSYPLIYKLGCTYTNPSIRAKQLYTTGVLYPFKIEFAKYVINYKEKEKQLHEILKEYRVKNNREFFKVQIEKIKLLFDFIDGEYYDNAELSYIKDIHKLDETNIDSDNEEIINENQKK
jgi:hypothetical protein